MKVTGILNINKPAGITSYDVVDVVKKIFEGSKVGHTGTLDPIATGVLPIIIGDATKLSNELMGEDKVYRVKLLLGVETNTYDITGRIVFASVIKNDEIYIRERIKRFIGVQEQIPPQYSAIKVDGKRAYEYAREGKTVKLKARNIEIYNIDNIAVDLRKREVIFDVHCTKGTYIRTLVNDIGKKIGCGATMLELTRLKNGNFDIKDSIGLYEFLRMEYKEMLKNIVTIEEYYKELKKISLKKDEYSKFLNGVKINFEETDKLVRVYNGNKYSGLGEIKDGKLKRYVIENE
ncbi:MAG: tRNA pseudouridine(55) synthase TruB [Clostridia bacterium]|nr:tRNA pseudouridine(55) synthase TruB [Clostridia bacterium]MDD4376288.1 tRNA pseudouridine(55) synthase TruB [Clostridia bacterium]